MSINRALFLDRDGVINHDLGYTSCVEDFVFIDGIFDLCRTARTAGYLLIVVTNQAGIGRGLYTEEDFSRLTKWMSDRFEMEGAKLTDVFYCPHHPEYGIGRYKSDSFDRKPNPGMLLNAAVKHSINLTNSIMIGDKDSDMLAASSACVGVRCQFLSNDQRNAPSGSSTHTVGTLLEATSLLI
jgi:D-glycero-D-manno-heptose 1,7-bisphosphate phosphatase